MTIQIREDMRSVRRPEWRNDGQHGRIARERYSSAVHEAHVASWRVRPSAQVRRTHPAYHLSRPTVTVQVYNGANRRSPSWTAYSSAPVKHSLWSKRAVVRSVVEIHRT